MKFQWNSTGQIDRKWKSDSWQTSYFTWSCNWNVVPSSFYKKIIAYWQRPQIYNRTATVLAPSQDIHFTSRQIPISLLKSRTVYGRLIRIHLSRLFLWKIHFHWRSEKNGNSSFQLKFWFLEKHRGRLHFPAATFPPCLLFLKCS